MISRRALARGLGMATASLAKADRRGNGPGRPITISATHVCYLEDDVRAYLAARGLVWTGDDVRPIATNEKAGGETPAAGRGTNGDLERTA